MVVCFCLIFIHCFLQLQAWNVCMSLPFLTEWNIVLYLPYIINYGLNNMQEVVDRPVNIWHLLCMKDIIRQSVLLLKVESCSSMCKVWAWDVSGNTAARILQCRLLYNIWSVMWPWKYDHSTHSSLCFYKYKGIKKSCTC